MAFARRYLQVDAGLVASRVRRLEFLHEDDDDAHEEPEVHLRSKDKQMAMTVAKDFPRPCLRLGCCSPDRAFAPPIKVPPRLIMQDGDVRTRIHLPSLPQDHRNDRREKKKNSIGVPRNKNEYHGRARKVSDFWKRKNKQGQGDGKPIMPDRQRRGYYRGESCPLEELQVRSHCTRGTRMDNHTHY